MKYNILILYRLLSPTLLCFRSLKVLLHCRPVSTNSTQTLIGNLRLRSSLATEFTTIM